MSPISLIKPSLHLCGIAIVLVAQLCPSAFAQETSLDKRMSRLEERVDAIDAKLDKVLRLLEHSSGSNQGRTARGIGAKPGEVSATSVRPGSVMVGYTVSRENYKTPQSNQGFVRNVDRGAAFSVRNVLVSEVAESHFKGSRIGVRWDGYFFARKTGNYTFKVETQSNSYARVIAKVGLNGEQILENTDSRRPSLESKELQSGYHHFSVWVAFDKSSPPLKREAIGKVAFAFEDEGDFKSVAPGTLFHIPSR